LAHVTIGYMIMIPVLIMQIFLFPYTAAVIMDTYEDSLVSMELQSTVGHISSSIQQLYYTINHGSFSYGSMQINLDVPQLIQGRSYTTTLSHVTSTDTSSQLMNVTLKIVGGTEMASSLVTLGTDADWQENLAFNSAAPSLSLVANKTANSVWISIGGN
jgi:VCBS repeat-containing protein